MTLLRSLSRWFSRKPPPAPATSPDRLVRVGCPAHNCGGRCLLIAHIRDGVIVRLDTDDRPDSVSSPQLRACVRGRAYLRRQYHPDRLLHPMKRVGPRGQGRFERISWDEALDKVAGELLRVKQTYGSSALFVPYGTGSYSQINGSHTARRLLNLFGGSLGFYNNYSWAAIQAATPTVFGTQNTGNQRQDWLNSKYILMWGWNPAEMRDETNTDYFIRLARQNGARVVCIDPRLSLSAASLADEWIPIRPGTDTAMLSAMAYVMITEGLYDASFVSTHCLGFDSSQMPPGLQDQESYSDYILGCRDGIPKTPDWAESITAVPAEVIARIAREYATLKPGVLYQGYGMQRRAYGEQVVRAGCVLAAITGNVGVSGGWASGIALPPGGGNLGTIFPVGQNPVPQKIPVYLWTEAVRRGPQLGSEHGVTGADSLDNSIKLIYSVASNLMLNQHSDINRTAATLQDESLVEFIVVQDNFLTPSGRYADVLLPACTQFETWGLEDGWKGNTDVLLMPKLVEPPGEARSDYRICAGLADRLGFGEAYTEGRDERAWIAHLIEHLREIRFPDIPPLDEFEASNIGVYGLPVEVPRVAFADFRQDPHKYPLDTPSGKIEIFSERLHRLGRPDEIPPLPKYIQEWESPFGPQASQYPLQAIGHHTLRRIHSTMENVDWLEEAFPQRAFMNPIDAETRGISDGDLVRIYNDRGVMVLPCRLTPRIFPGLVDIPQGAWWTPDKDGVDRRGAVNLLVSERWTPYAFGNAQHTLLVQVEKAAQDPDPRGIASFPVHQLRPQVQPEPAAPGAKQWAFYFDASGCSGCKACQTACKDHNGLPVGLLWRRVYEVSGGDWRKQGQAWQQNVFAYNLSISCNHCEQPVCVEVCPSKALYKRLDSIVLVDAQKCLGCQYCSWVCPYDALQFDPQARVMTKCTFCADEIDLGRPPACVAACPLRVLQYGEKSELERQFPGAAARAEIYPLPAERLTRPALRLHPHQHSQRPETGPASIANREEV